MSLAASKPRPSGRIYTCKVAELIRADDNPEGAEENVAAQFADKGNSDRALGDWLGVSEGTAAKHRTGACACGRS